MKLATTPQSKEQSKKSNTYIKYEKLLLQIEQQKQFKLNLQEGLKKAYHKIEQEILPIQQELQTLLREFMIRLDTLATEIGVGKLNKEYLETYMAEELEILLDTFGHQDVVLSNLYQKYAGVSLDDLATDEDALEIAKSISELLGVEVDVKELLKKGQQGFFEEFREKFAGQINNKDFIDTEDSEISSNKPAGKKTTSETDQIAKDARSIYMRLVKKFHPDLEPNQVLKDHKTEIIKEVTKAYQENDFLSLLKLQITHLDDDDANVASIADDMVKRYIKLLQKQLDELNASIHETHFTNGNEIADFIDKNGKFSPQKFSARRRNLEKQISAIRSSLTSSAKKPKGWFKEQMSMIKDTVMQNMMNDMFADMFDHFN
ncbi:hypothetical protein [Mucilaginibacter flavus]|uniref:hypothetical protein n=1 Tax=Mucilaginibacter flavus TaxID=931504 RepID=UPI0025B3BA97|nr:hypothetical protein [Mucilaginibacter flavus]MDN3581282.1 hypothetical protein [Mucilaginibacter flavus]